MPQFVKDVEEIRQRASRKIEEGAVTESYKGDVHRTVAILNEALATEIVCVLRYLHHYFMATGVHGRSVAAEFKEHADAEREHADRIGERIQQLGGKPDFNPKGLLERSASQYIEGETLADMIREDLIAERMVIEVYQEMIRYFRDNDPTTRHMLEEILEDEEEHASDLVDLLYITDPHTGETEGQDPGTRPLQLESRNEGGQRRQGRNAAGKSDALHGLQKMGGSGASGQHIGRPTAEVGDGSIALEPNPHQQRSGEARQQPVRPEPQQRGREQQGRQQQGRGDQRQKQAQQQDEQQHLDSGSRPMGKISERQRTEQFAGRGSVNGEKRGTEERGKGGKKNRVA